MITLSSKDKPLDLLSENFTRIVLILKSNMLGSDPSGADVGAAQFIIMELHCLKVSPPVFKVNNRSTETRTGN